MTTEGLGVDARWLSKPERFRNAQEQWPSWKFQFINFLALFHTSYPDVLDQCAQASADIEIDRGRDEAFFDKGRWLYSILISFFQKGKAFNIARSVRDRNGWQVWRLLCLEYEPKLPSKSLMLLQRVMKPDHLATAGLKEFEERLLEWEDMIE